LSSFMSISQVELGTGSPLFGRKSLKKNEIRVPQGNLLAL
jgi:hypothetical protein